MYFAHAQEDLNLHILSMLNCTFSHKFQVNWPFHSGAKFKTDFQDGSHEDHVGFPIGMILAIFDLQVTPILPIKFHINWHFCLQEIKNRFSRWWLFRDNWPFSSGEAQN